MCILGTKITRSSQIMPKPSVIFKQQVCHFVPIPKTKVHTKKLMRLKTTLEAKMCTLKLCVMYVHKTFTCIPLLKQHRVADRHVVGKYSTQNSVRSICLKCSFALLLLRYTYTCETFPEFWQVHYCLIPAALFSCVESLSMTRTVTNVQSVFDHINPIVAS